MGVTTDRVKEPFPLPAKHRRRDPAGARRRRRRAGQPRGFALAPNTNMGVKAINRLLKAGAKALVGRRTTR